MVDQALKTNSLAVIDQYIRQVEDNLEDLEDAAATVGGEVRSIERKLSRVRAEGRRTGSRHRRLSDRRQRDCRGRGPEQAQQHQTTG